MQNTEFRVFISSTFQDLQEEREHLVKKIFPEVRARCRERGITFTEVDLRWGVTEEDVTSGRVIRTCLEEVDRSRPYFIGITGDRYGFVPQATEITADPELIKRFPWIPDAVAEGASLTDLEFRYGALNQLANESEGHRAFFYSRQRLWDRDSAAPDRMKLSALERRARARGYNVSGYQSADKLGEMIREELLAILDRDFANAKPPTPLESERMKHEAFASSRRHAYIPNKEYSEWLDTFAKSEEPPLVIYAESGAGKSSLVAHWAASYRERNPETAVIEHYIGIGASATDHFGVMRHIMEEIKERYDRTEEIPGTPEELERQFANWLGFTMQNPVVLIIDGVNQLSGIAAKLEWLPRFWPKNIRFIITATAEETLNDLKKRDWSEMRVRPLLPQERKAIIVQFLREYGKALSELEIERIASDSKCAHPLFLRTLLEELRIFGSHELLSERVTRALSTANTDELFQAVLERMEMDFGNAQVKDVMSLLWAARTGLAESELVDVTAISRLDISMITMSLDYHLLRREGLLTFFHDFLRRAVESRYLNVDEDKRLRHLALADYFEKIVNELVEKELAESVET
jgi:nephrocystin-3